MTRLDRKVQFVAVGLAVMAGIVDASGFMASGGFFVSFMSGNSTRFAVGVSQSAAYLIFVAAIIGSFVFGVFASSLFGHLTQLTDRQRQSRILLVIALILAVVPYLASVDFVVAALCSAAFCMGVENTIFAQKGSATFGVTYMTGALVKIGQGFAALISGADSKELLPYLMLWAGLIFGAVLGAFLYGRIGLYSIWVAAGIAGFLCVILARIDAGALDTRAV
jgi:uncharacterized membrane protein YoaK (UPF0700 family)